MIKICKIELGVFFVLFLVKGVEFDFWDIFCVDNRFVEMVWVFCVVNDWLVVLKYK